ncbi:polyprenyl synthetase family protein [Nocardia sp. CA-151230]|uniref:class 1 isoprenoid biosynthesis enzyme n=1 Tax=Nocardia sp. CA-151230 TaxID=3239982 RepID=UPI003D9464E6
MVHNLTMIHDDVMDGDPLRRGRPVAWRLGASMTRPWLGTVCAAWAADLIIRAGGKAWAQAESLRHVRSAGPCSPGGPPRICRRWPVVPGRDKLNSDK